MNIFSHRISLIFLLMLFSGLGCSKLSLDRTESTTKEDPRVTEFRATASKVNDASFNKYMLGVESNPNKYEKNSQLYCRVFQANPTQKLTFNHKNIVNCFSSVSDKYVPYLVKKLLEYKPRVPNATLTKVVEYISQGYAQHTESIKNLIKAGAVTENINLDYIRMGNTRVCESLEVILKNNKLLYENVLKTKSKKFQREALHNLSASGMEINLCNNEIRLLASYNPELLNYQSGYYGIPLIAYLNDSGWDEWDIQTARLLMTKKNINLQSENNVTPMQHALMSPPYSRRNEKDILKTGKALGADFTLKSKPYSSGSSKKKVNVNELILTTRPKLLGFIKNGESLHACFKGFYSRLDKILNHKEKIFLKKTNLYTHPRIKWLEEKLITVLPLPSSNSCIKEYFKVIDEKDKNIMASRVIDAYRNHLNQH